VVLISGALLSVAGVLIALLLPVATSWRLLATAGWLALGVAEWGRIAFCYRQCAGYRLFHDGSIEILLHGGGLETARLGAGSLVLARMAWLRVEADCGWCCGELVFGNVRRSEDWRRLQVIGRHPAPC
jgi:hypothetical protein